MTLSGNSDGLPILPRITYLTDDRLYSDTAEESDEILKYLLYDNSNKSSVPDAISNHSLKFCDDILHKHLT